MAWARESGTHLLFSLRGVVDSAFGAIARWTSQIICKYSAPEIPPGANGYVSIDLSTLLGVESIPAAKADWDTITVEVDTPLPPDYIPTYQQLVDLFLYDVTGTAIGQSYRFYTAIVSRAQSSQPGIPPNFGVHATEVRPEAGPLHEAAIPAPGDGPVHKPAPGVEVPAPRPARHPILAWIAALFKWLLGRLRADK